jgi:asparagine synthase (glutamine-hydrolysing)
LIRCGGFFFSYDKETASAAANSAGRIAVAGTKVRVRDGADAGLGPRGTLVSLDYEGAASPVVHGFVGDEPDGGEFSMLSETASGLEGRRDFAGSRPLYVGESGKWVASDHRFLPGQRMEMIPPNSSVRLAGGKPNRIRIATPSFEDDFDEAVAKLALLIRDSVKSRVAGMRRIAVSFSGGLDSSIIAHCAASYCKVTACSVSAEGSTDSRVAKDSASVLGLEFSRAKVTERIIAKELRGLALPFDPSPMDKSLWCIYSITAKLAAESGAQIAMLGQLADELFGGYAKYETALRQQGDPEAEKMMSDDIAQCGMRGFIRDEAACRKWCEPRFPFAERKLALFAKGLPVTFKIREGVRKAVLREAALLLGVPREFAQRPKKAAQYSSGVLKLLG